jgi:hypothetical protein
LFRVTQSVSNHLGGVKACMGAQTPKGASVASADGAVAAAKIMADSAVTAAKITADGAVASATITAGSTVTAAQIAAVVAVAVAATGLFVASLGHNSLKSDLEKAQKTAEDAEISLTKSLAVLEPAVAAQEKIKKARDEYKMCSERALPFFGNRCGDEFHDAVTKALQ